MDPKTPRAFDFCVPCVCMPPDHTWVWCADPLCHFLCTNTLCKGTKGCSARTAYDSIADFRLLVPSRKNKSKLTNQMQDISKHHWVWRIWLVTLVFHFSAMGQATWNQLYKRHVVNLILLPQRLAIVLALLCPLPLPLLGCVIDEHQLNSLMRCCVISCSVFQLLYNAVKCWPVCVWNSVHSNQGQSQLPILWYLFSLPLSPPPCCLHTVHLPRVHCVPSTLHSGVHLCNCIKCGRSVLSQQLCDSRPTLPVVVCSGTPYQQIILGPCSTAHAGSLLLQGNQEAHLKLSLGFLHSSMRVPKQ